MPGRLARSRLPWALLALGVGYLLLVAGPLWNARGSLSTWVRDLAAGAAGQPLAVGLALLGAAALVFVIARLVHDLELHPYASLAPVLTVFSGLVLSSVRGQLPFPGVGGDQLGLAGLALALLGGALIGRQELGARLLGMALAALPTLSLLLALSALRGESDPLSMLRAVDPVTRAYLALLAVSSLALGLVGNFARRMVRRREQAQVPPTLRMPSQTPLDMRVSEPLLLPPPRHTPPQPLRQTLPMHAAAALGRESPAAFAASYVPGSYARAYPQPNAALALDDPDLLALTRKRPLAKLAWLAVVCLGLASLGGYFLVLKPERERAAQAERARALKVAQQRAAAADPAATGDLADRMSRYLRQRQEEQRSAPPLGTMPTVTSLSAPAQQAAAPSTAEPAREPAAQVEPRREHRRHRAHARREAAPAAEKAPSLNAKIEPKAEAKPAPRPEAVKPAPVAKPAPKTQNERELDLDDLLHKSLNGSGSASDDPILGL
jgi:hypothetical protein